MAMKDEDYLKALCTVRTTLFGERGYHTGWNRNRLKRKSNATLQGLKPRIGTKTV